MSVQSESVRQATCTVLVAGIPLLLACYIYNSCDFVLINHSYSFCKCLFMGCHPGRCQKSVQVFRENLFCAETPPLSPDGPRCDGKILELFRH